ncbi:NosD domain-containing protein [Tropicibacter oceani]|uniref:Right-handed parallel beta-helix repeat-containing protein n=1 Tax=Tropicibacter oceani TaxID=3058420 RepID=A0ABY8QIM3_9RHOB|nr:right-handed parallel beta-helix repeat-containing protein [Tropicibacter oceani]WGW04288.1 right-handed parallel beta-helix repeat-containing protein [Tropicibacter oceani]
MARTLIPALAAAMMLCASLLVSGPARAAPDPALVRLTTQLDQLSDLLKSDAAARSLPLELLLLRTGLTGLTDALPRAGRDAAGTVDAPPPPQGPPAQASVETFRTALAVLSQVHGGQDNLDVLLAHPGDRTDALTFRSGVVTLDHIRQSLRDTGLQADMAPGHDTLRVPVILWEDTLLQLGPHDRLGLSRADGVFVISFGRVELDGARVFSVGGESPTSKDFVPFVTIAGGGSLNARGASFDGLGFGNTPKFSGVSIVSHPLMPSTGNTRIADSHFENLVTVAMTGGEAAVITGNRFYNMRNNALMLANAVGAQVHGNLFFGDGPTNAVRVLAGSDDAVVRGNVLLEGDRSGILVQGQSTRVEVSGNVIWRRSGGAIKLSGTRCGVVRGNVILNSRQKGIDIRSSDATQVHANTISGSGSAGIWVSAQPRQAVTYLSQNTLRGNGAGLSTATGARLFLAGNDFSNQFPRLIDGDLTLQNHAIVRDLHGKTPMLMSASETVVPSSLAAPDCSDWGQK